MKLLKYSRKFHKWLMLFLGVQFLIWSVSGAFMVIFDIDYIHGDTLVVSHQTKIEPENINHSIAKLRKDYPKPTEIEVSTFIGQPVYRFKHQGEYFLVNAQNGQQLSPINEATAVKAANHYYSGKGEINNVTLIIDNPPFELSRRVLPAWRVDFDDFSAPSIYVSAQTGKLVTKRHDYWRIFDWMFSFHVMDYKEEDASNLLLFWFALFSIISAVFGGILSYFVIKNQTYSNANDEAISSSVIHSRGDK